ncbi:MAG: aldehyde dehydrogenase EutE [bacterium]|nr:aldehyde dehydrogenase EutE [bacterium]
MGEAQTVVNKTLVAEVVSEVLARMGAPAEAVAAPAGTPSVGPGPSSATPGAGDWGVFADVDAAVAAAAEAQRQLHQATLGGRAAAVECIREVLRRDRDELARLEFEETRLGRLEHKREKLDLAAGVPGVEMLRSEAVSGDHGLTVTEFAPYGVIGVVTPVTHSVPTLGCNAIMMIAAGNALVCNPHPSAARCAAEATRRWNRAIGERIGIENLICLIENPTLESAAAIFGHAKVRLLCATGGPAVAAAALRSGKRAVVAGPGNPPVVVDETADLDKAARGIVTGASYDNNLLCIGEKEVFVVELVAESLMTAMQGCGGHRLPAEQMERFAERFIRRDEQSGHFVPDKRLVGQDASVLAEAVDIRVGTDVQLLFGPTDEDNPLVSCEQMMPILPIVPVADVDVAIAKAVRYEHGFKHTAIMWSRDVERLTRMGRACEATIFVKNGPCLAGLGVGGEGYASFSNASPTGEGVTSPLSFTRLRRCVMVDSLRIV